jgi:hypothetical protein
MLGQRNAARQQRASVCCAQRPDWQRPCSSSQRLHGAQPRAHHRPTCWGMHSCARTPVPSCQPPPWPHTHALPSSSTAPVVVCVGVCWCVLVCVGVCCSSWRQRARNTHRASHATLATRLQQRRLPRPAHLSGTRRPRCAPHARQRALSAASAAAATAGALRAHACRRQRGSRTTRVKRGSRRTRVKRGSRRTRVKRGSRRTRVTRGSRRTRIKRGSRRTSAGG